jgi:hypothetical protein
MKKRQFLCGRGGEMPPSLTRLKAVDIIRKNANSRRNHYGKNSARYSGYDPEGKYSNDRL